MSDKNDQLQLHYDATIIIMYNNYEVIVIRCCATLQLARSSKIYMSFLTKPNVCISIVIKFWYTSSLHHILMPYIADR